MAPSRKSQQVWQAPQPQPWKPQLRPSPAGDWDVPLFCFLNAILAGAACLFYVLYSLGQPAINPNPGLAAYVPPAGTRLVPLPRVSDAPELAEIPVDPPSPLTALAQAQSSDQQAKRDTRPPPRKRPRPA